MGRVNDYVYERMAPRVVAQTATALNASIQAAKSAQEAKDAASVVSDSVQQVRHEGDRQEARVREAGSSQSSAISAKGASVASRLDAKVSQAEMWAGEAQRAAEQAVGATGGVAERVTNLETAVSGKQDALSESQLAVLDIDVTELAKTEDLAQVALTGAYSDLSGTPSIPTKLSQLQNDTGFISDVSSKQDVIDDLDVIRAGASSGVAALDAVEVKMERYVIRLVRNADNTFKLTSIEDADLTFQEVYDVTRRLNEYVVVVYGNSKLRPQYVSTNEIMCIGLDRSTESKVLRLLVTPTRLTYEAFKLAEYADLPVVPSNISAFTNDAGYITEMGDIDCGYIVE